MICTVDGVRFVGRSVGLSHEIEPARIHAAIHRGYSEGSPPVSVQARRPGPVHHRLGCVTPETGIRIKTSLAAIGRGRGLTTPVDSEIRTLESRLEAMETDGGVPNSDRRAVAADGAITTELREQVSELRGRLAVRRDHDLPTGPTAAALEAAVGDLSAAETDAIAAEQALERARATARGQRDRLSARMTIEDDLGNARRRARASLVDQLRDAYTAALRACPGGDTDSPFDVDSVSAGLALAKLARFDAPVVLAVERFADPGAASAWLDAPVLGLEFR